MASKEKPTEDGSSPVPSLEDASQSESNELPTAGNRSETQRGTEISDDITCTSQEQIQRVDNATGETLPSKTNGSQARDPSISDNTTDDNTEDMEVDEAEQMSSALSHHGNSQDSNVGANGGTDYQSKNEDTPDSDSSNEEWWSAVASSEDQRDREEMKNKLRGDKNKPKNVAKGGGKYFPKIRIPKEPSFWSSRDTIAYRKGYPGKRDNPRFTKNYEFYTNQIPSIPNGDFIEVIHKEWWGNYDHLEWHHGYIQWLFPIRESGLNWHSQELQLHEVKKICADTEAHQRVLRSYEMMLDFYGMKMDRKDGSVQRAENWKDRFRHLNSSMHNYLRITRILKCLGEFNYEHYKSPFVRFVLHEAIIERTLTGTLDSCMNYWVEVIKKDEERKEIRKYAETLAADANSDHERRKTH